jgi:hypothetical protein
MKYLITFIALFFHWSESQACKCYPIPVKDNYEASTMVLRGEVITVDTVQQFFDGKPKGWYTVLHLATIKIDKTYKGEATANDTLRVITGNGRADCGYHFIPGTEYIFYGFEREYSIIDSTILPAMEFVVSKRRYLYTNNCDRTTAEVAAEEKLLKEFLNRRKTGQ